MAAFATCALLTSLSMFAASQPKGPLLLASLLVIGFGSLGLFPIYYSLTQELSTRHQGKVTGSLSFITWAMTAEMQVLVGKQVDQTGSYANGIFWLGLTPLVGFIALVCLWGRTHAPEGNGSAVSEG
jgi:ACS family hexuronate transporter-like MFS transporter